MYENSGFVIRPWMQIGYAQSLAGPYEFMYNSGMSSAQEVPEWSYKNLKKKLYFNQFSKKYSKNERLPLP